MKDGSMEIQSQKVLKISKRGIDDGYTEAAMQKTGDRNTEVKEKRGRTALALASRWLTGSTSSLTNAI